ncbi:hypothetical protein [Mucilaginibacter sp.]|uniref:hypothetical protein n=1 Tax=Mucilaginibacter sp. TaxID=1882438 RepID=UPI003AFF93BD
MGEVFLEIDASKLILANLKEHELPLPVFIAEDNNNIFFLTEEEYCDYLKEIEKISTKVLAEYWLIKTPKLIEKNRFIVKVLTVLQSARANKLLNNFD